MNRPSLTAARYGKKLSINRLIAGDGLQITPYGLWHPDTLENREILTIATESDNESYGPNSHWIEERQA